MYVTSVVGVDMNLAFVWEIEMYLVVVWVIKIVLVFHAWRKTTWF